MMRLRSWLISAWNAKVSASAIGYQKLTTEKQSQAGTEANCKRAKCTSREEQIADK